MKNLILKNPGFEYLETGFRQWLDILGYCEQGVYNMPNNLREFLHHLEQQQVNNIRQLEQKHIKSYYEYINTRPNERRGGGLSNKYVVMHLQAVAKFLEYLNYKGVPGVPSLGMKMPAYTSKLPQVLTVEEIRALFEAANKEESSPKQEALQARDRALLVVVYSCGLRRNEAVNVNIDDINFDTRILHVKKGKKYKQRLVPFNKTNAKYLEEYVFDHRPVLAQSKQESSLFVNASGKPLTGGTLYTRLRQLQAKTDNIELSQKAIGLHTLRHSIATHLLQGGMSLEKIARFLGHASMDSTQIYTHLTAENH